MSIQTWKFHRWNCPTGGEVFLNKEILDVLKYAYTQNVALTVGNGLNLNDVRPEVLKALLVKYNMRFMTCSIDGASQETWQETEFHAADRDEYREILECLKKPAWESA